MKLKAFLKATGEEVKLNGQKTLLLSTTESERERNAVRILPGMQ